MSSDKKCASLLLLLFSCTFALFANDPISFKGGYTKAVMINGQESISLSQGSLIEFGSITLNAESIEIIGPNASTLEAFGSVSIKDSDKNIEIKSNKLNFNRETHLLTVDGWVEIEDLQNEMIASGGYLLYNSETGNMLLQVAASLVRTSDDGLMIIQGNSIEFDRERQIMKVVGSSVITFKGDTYHSQVTTINLENNEITMSGDIEGTIHE
jgi:lipopolysaccharide export system protein LptA